MFSFLKILIGLLVLYFSNHKLSLEFSRLIHRFGGDRNSLIVLWSIIFLPGTVIHEMSHFIFAMLTGARTGKIEIFPRFLEEEWESEGKSSGVTMGYVQTQKLNLIQGFLVGTAPFVVGIILLIWLSISIRSSYESSNIYTLILQGYLFFTVSNSFFPSWADIKQVIPLTVVVLVFIIFGWLVGFNFAYTPNSQIISISEIISSVFFLSTLLNALFVLLLWLVRRFFRVRR